MGAPYIYIYIYDISTLWVKTYARCIVTHDTNLPQKHCCTTLNSRQWSIVQQQTIVVFALQQWSSERATMSLLVHCLSCFICCIPSMALQPLLGTALPQKTLHSSLSSARLLHPRIPSGITSSHYVLGFPTGLALPNIPLRTFYRVFNIKVDRILIWVIYLLRFTTCYITQLSCICSKCWKWCPFISMHLSTGFTMFLAIFLSVLSFTSSMARVIFIFKILNFSRKHCLQWA